MKWIGAPGVRARLVGVLLAGAALSGAAIVLVFKPLVLSNISFQGSERLLWAARTAAITAPAEPRQWDFWVRVLDERVKEATVFLLKAHPGQPHFSEDCERFGVSAEHALTAYAESEHVAFPDTSLITGTGGYYQALVRLNGMQGERALLGFRDARGGNAPQASSVWALWLLYLGMAFALAIAGGYLVGYLLLVKPVIRAASVADRAMPPGTMAPPGDLESIRSRMDALVRANRESERRANRLSVELDRIRADLKGAQATLLRAEKLASVGQLAAGVAHEIGNPVGIILGLSDLIKGGGSDEEEVRRFAAEVNSAASRVDGIIKDLLTFARPARDEQASADLREVVEATIKLMKPHQRFREVEVEVDLEDGPLMAEIRGSQLQQVLVNLLLNAADAMRGMGVVTVRASREDRYLRLEVEDRGPGIKKGDSERVFDPFYTTKAPGEGTGLGLAICAQIVEVYGGEITVDNGPDGGARFSVRLWQPEEV